MPPSCVWWQSVSAQLCPSLTLTIIWSVFVWQHRQPQCSTLCSRPSRNINWSVSSCMETSQKHSRISALFLRSLCAAYSELVSAYTANNQAELWVAVTKHQEMFPADNIMGLVRQATSSQVLSSIRRLTRTFITLSPADLATRRSELISILSMIQAGSIQARI